MKHFWGNPQTAEGIHAGWISLIRLLLVSLKQNSISVCSCFPGSSLVRQIIQFEHWKQNWGLIFRKKNEPCLLHSLGYIIKYPNWLSSIRSKTFWHNLKSRRTYHFKLNWLTIRWCFSTFRFSLCSVALISL